MRSPWPTLTLTDAPQEVRLGGVGVYVAAQGQDLVLALRQDGDPFDLDVGVVTPDDEPESARRFIFATRPDEVRLVPRLADRAVIARPLDDVRLPPGETIGLYVSTPLWVSVMMSSHPTPIFDAPLHVPRETWFGPSTTRGEICYASRTRAATDLGALRERPNRAITFVRLTNGGSDAVELDRVRLPVPALDIAWSGDRFVTPDLRMRRESDGMGGLAIGELPTGSEAVGSAREPRHEPAWRHALDALWRSA